MRGVKPQVGAAVLSGRGDVANKLHGLLLVHVAGERVADAFVFHDRDGQALSARHADLVTAELLREVARRSEVNATGIKNENADASRSSRARAAKFVLNDGGALVLKRQDSCAHELGSACRKVLAKRYANVLF